jgi:hypothetical protein
MICAVASVALVTGQSLDFPGDDENPDEEKSGGLLNADLMPDGGILKNVLIPQYDGNLLLTATLRAEEMKIAVAKDTAKLEKAGAREDREDRRHRATRDPPEEGEGGTEKDGSNQAHRRHQGSVGVFQFGPDSPRQDRHGHRAV